MKKLDKAKDKDSLNGSGPKNMKVSQGHAPDSGLVLSLPQGQPMISGIISLPQGQPMISGIIGGDP